MEGSVGRITVEEEDGAATLLEEGQRVAGRDTVTSGFEFVEFIFVFLSGGKSGGVVGKEAATEVDGVEGGVIDFYPSGMTAVLISEVILVFDEDFVQPQVDDGLSIQGECAHQDGEGEENMFKFVHYDAGIR